MLISTFQLYEADEFSSMICSSCCTGLFNAFVFINKVRNSESQLQSRKKSISDESQPSDSKKPKLHQKAELTTEHNSSENIVEIIPDNDIPPESEQFSEEEHMEYIVEYEESSKPDRIVPETNAKVIAGFPDSIIITHYTLEKLKDNDQNVAVLNVSSIEIQQNSKDGQFTIDDSWLKDADPSVIYRCKYCMKAFSNASYLLQHVKSSHLCIHCLLILPSYKSLNQHYKDDHSVIICSLCQRQFNTSVSYRQHLKKNHLLSLPAHISILPSLGLEEQKSP